MLSNYSCPPFFAVALLPLIHCFCCSHYLWGFCVYTTFCPSSFALILMENRELVALVVLIVLLLTLDC